VQQIILPITPSASAMIRFQVGNARERNGRRTVQLSSQPHG